jgi:probable rRNA maturation factor
MSVTIDIIISEDLVSVHGASDTPESGEDDVPEPGMLQSWAEAAYLGETPAVASMLITTSEEIQQLNKQYRDKDKATNVLSFPMELPEGLPGELSEELVHEMSQEMFEQDGASLLGDIALCAPVIKQEAIQQSKSEKEHWAHMVVHGMLHLQGYDHVEEAEAEVMERLEVEILDRLGFSDPYQ